MKKIVMLLAFVMVTLSLQAQSKRERESRDLFWNDTNADALVTAIPEKWTNESAVIIYKNEEYTYVNLAKYVYHTTSLHYRIKLQDKNAIEKFSQFSYPIFLGNKRNFSFQEFINVGIKIIKPDGKEVILDIEKERVETDASGERLYKVAIPNLEIGDIVDIYKLTTEQTDSYDGTHLFPKIERTVAEEYPVVKKKLAIEVENDFFLRMESFNGAPAIVEVPTKKRSTSRYVFEATDIEKQPLARWSFPLVDSPSIKLQVVFALRKINEFFVDFFMTKKDRERGSFATSEEIAAYIKRTSYFEGSVPNYKELKQAILDKGVKSELEILNQIIYFLRHFKYTSWTEPIIAYRSEIIADGAPCINYSYINSQDKLVEDLKSLLKQYNIDFEILLTKPRYDGPMSQTLLRSNVETGLKINVKDAPPVYLFDFGPHMSTSTINPLLEGTVAKLYSPFKLNKIKTEDIKDHIIPSSTANDNMAIEKSNIVINNDWTGFNINRDRKYYGQQKSERQDRLVDIPNYLQEDFDYFGTKRFYDCSKNQNKKNQDVQKKLEAIFAEGNKKNEETALDIVKSEFDINIDSYEIKLLESGRYDATAPLHITDSFTMGNDFIKKAGPNYIVEVGKFIGGQITIDPLEYDRKVPINLDYATTYSSEVRIKIPVGFTVDGIEKLNKSVSNDTGSFISTARIDGDYLVYTTTKTYLKATFPVSQWPDMIKWLDEANTFTREKILFKKS